MIAEKFGMKISTFGNALNEDWRNNYLNMPDAQRTEFLTALTTLWKDISLYWNLLILNGEYISEAEKIEEYIQELTESIERSRPANDDQVEILNAFYLTFEKEVFTPFENCSLSYFNFQEYISHKILNLDSETIIVGDEFGTDWRLTDKDILLAQKSDPIIYELLLKLNIFTAILDHRISTNENKISDLIKIIWKTEQLEEFITDEQKIIIEIIRDKSQFLLNKSKYRNQKNIYITRYQYLEELDEIYDSSTKYFTSLEEKSKGHHARQKNKHLDKKNIKKLSKESKTTLLHQAAQYYTDIDHEPKNIEEISFLFKEKKINYHNTRGDDSLLKAYDDYAYEVNDIYFANCKISNYITELKNNIKKHPKSIKEINKILREIGNINRLQSLSGIRNYFPYYVAAEAFSLVLDEILSKDTIEDPETAKDLLNYSKKWVRIALENLIWCREMDFRYFQAPFEECKIPVENMPINTLFCASSYTYPSDYSKKELEIIELHKMIDGQQFKYDLSEKISRSYKSQEYLKDEIKSSKIDNIAVLGLFASVALATSGSFQILSKEIPVETTLFFILIIGATISIFALSMWAIINSSSKNNWRIALIFFLALFAILFSYLHISDYNDEQTRKREKITQDSMDIYKSLIEKYRLK